MAVVASLALIFVAIGLAALGVVRGSDLPLVGSITASLLAVVTLLVGQRRAAAARLAEASGADGFGADGFGAESSGANEEVLRSRPADRSRPIIRDGDGAVVVGRAPTVTIPVQADAGYETARKDSTTSAGHVELAITPARADDYGDYEEEDPPDEPPPQQVPAEEAERVARMSTIVLVVDGRPRYHLASCAHLAGRDSEEISVREAVELGFTPCSVCEPASALLAEARPA